MAPVSKVSPKGVDAVKIWVDADKCQGHNRCYNISSELFDVDDEGYATALNDGEVPAGLEAKAELAILNCPERAISIVEGARP